MSTFGPDYDPTIDGGRLARQMDVIREFMLTTQEWLTLKEVSTATKYPEASVSAQLRHLRKPQFGGYLVEKRRREQMGGTWEYRVLPPPMPTQQVAMFAEATDGRV